MMPPDARVPTTPPGRTVADQLLDYLALEGATVLFGIPGAGNANLLRRLRHRPEFRFIVTRHETGAAYIADGYFRATGKPGVVLATSGPGATNALTGAMNASFAGSAMLVLTGEAGEQYMGRGYLQEGTDLGLNIRDIFAAAVRYSVDVSSASSAPILFEQALRTMRARPRRGAHLGLPDSVAGLLAENGIALRPPASPSAYRVVPEGAPDAGVRRVLDALARATRPLLLLGNGCREALRDPATARALRCLVEWWQIPVMTTTNGKGVFDETHALSLRTYGFAGCQWPQYWMRRDDGTAAHDALVVIGSSLGELSTYRWNPMLLPAGPFVQIDIDQWVIGRGFPITDGIVAEAGAFIRALWDLAPSWSLPPGRPGQRAERVAAIKAAHDAVAAPADYDSTAAPMQPAALCRVLNERLPARAMVFVDSGNCVGWAMHYLVARAGQEVHASLGMGPMGFAVGAVVGARFGCPDRVAVALVGDGAFMMQAGEVATAATIGVGAIWIVLADGDLGMVTQGMAKLFGEDFDGAYALGRPDLAMVAHGFGADAFDAASPDEFAQAFDRALQGAEAGRPQVIVARIDPCASPPYYAAPYWSGKPA